MKKFLTVPILVILVVMFSFGTASAEWLYATEGNTYVHVATDRESSTIGVFTKGRKIWVYNHILTSDGRNWCKVNFLGEEGYISDLYSSYNVADESSYTDVNANMNSNHGFDLSWFDDDEQNEYDEGRHYFYDYSKQVDFEFVADRDTYIYYWYEGNFPIGTLERQKSAFSNMIFTSEEDNKAYIEVYDDDEDDYVYIQTDDLHIATPGKFPKLSRLMEVTGETVNVRRNPNINSESLEIIEKGTVLTADFFVCVFDGEYRIWAICSDPYGDEIGCVSCKYLEPVQ